MPSIVYAAIHYVLMLAVALIIIDAVLTFFPSVPTYHPIVLLIRRMTRPLIGPFRKIVPPQRLGDAYIDLSPVLAIIAIYIVDAILASSVRGR
jgi:uncharacterized protein YggT (Ycf19 family)